MGLAIADLPEQEYMLPGNRTCSGCGLSVAFRYILKALEGDMIAVVPASCLTVLGGMYPQSSVRIPWLNVAFPEMSAEERLQRMEAHIRNLEERIRSQDEVVREKEARLAEQARGEGHQTAGEGPAGGDALRHRSTL